MTEVVKEWDILPSSHLCWEVHMCKKVRRLTPSIGQKMSKDVYKTKQTFQSITEALIHIFRYAFMSMMH